MNPTRTTRSLVRVILGLLAVSGLLAAGSWDAVTLAPCSAAEAARFRPHGTIYCDVMTRLAVDYLNDPETPISAFQATVGEVAADRLAKFKVYGLTDDPRFYSDVSYEKQAMSFQVRTPPGSSPVDGKWVYTESSANPIYAFYSGRHGSEKERVAFLDFGYQCVSPRKTFRTRFLLTVRPEGWVRPELPPPSDSKPDLGGQWQEARIVSTSAAAGQGYGLMGSLRLTNDGQADAVASRAAFFLSRDRRLDPDDFFAGFADLPAAPAGSEQAVDLDVPFGGIRWVGRKYVIAVLDSSNYVYESNENNVVVSELP